jgi:hypothetical protein
LLRVYPVADCGDLLCGTSFPCSKNRTRSRKPKECTTFCAYNLAFSAKKNEMHKLPRIDDVVSSFASVAPVAGLTHTFYRYPARFSPEFVRSAISAFSEPGDLVLDPFMGGGTTAVEALAAGRKFLGTDLNRLALFIAATKTTPLNKNDCNRITEWAAFVEAELGSWDFGAELGKGDDKLTRNIPWWLRRTLARALSTVCVLDNQRQQSFARCSLLKTAQWALDCRTEVPLSRDFIRKHKCDVAEMIAAAVTFRACAGASSARNRRLLNVPAAQLAQSTSRFRHWLPAKLVLTSPPYPGVHVLYHRWQVRGRKETPAPYWIAGCLDGQGASFYTFGDRRRATLRHYWHSVESSFKALAPLVSNEGLIVQVLAFRNPAGELDEYMAAMARAGFTAVEYQTAERTVPNRKWYADVKGSLASAREFLLIHRKSG